MLAHGGKQNFPKTARCQRHDVNREEKQSTMDKIGDGIVRVVTENTRYGTAPTRSFSQTQCLHRMVGLITRIEQGHQHTRQCGNPNIGHNPFEVYRVTHMGAADGDIRGCKEERIHHFIYGIQHFITPTLVEVWV